MVFDSYGKCFFLIHILPLKPVKLELVQDSQFKY